MAKKVKNESAENRATVLALWCGKLAESDRAGRIEMSTKGASGEGADKLQQYRRSYEQSSRLVQLELLPLWQEMMEDALASQDLDDDLSNTPHWSGTGDNKTVDISHLVTPRVHV